MARKISNVIVERISLLIGKDPAVPNANTKRSLLKMRKPTIEASIKARLEKLAKNLE